jgi:hypothetical protein
VRELESRIMESKTNANLLVELLQQLQPSHDATIIFAAGSALRRIFTRYLTDGELLLTTKAVTAAAAEKSASGTFRVWLHKNYIKYQRCMLAQLRNTELRLQNTALHTLMDIVRTQVDHNDKSLLATNDLFAKVRPLPIYHLLIL